jgi:glycerol uptake facilitator-like aquaporin
MWSKLFTELIGTFVFLFVILVTGNPLAIAISLAAAIYFGIGISGGHFNPAVTIMEFVKGDDSSHVKDPLAMFGYILAQIAGGLLAFGFYKLTGEPTVKNAGEHMITYSHS